MSALTITLTVSCKVLFNPKFRITICHNEDVYSGGV